MEVRKAGDEWIIGSNYGMLVTDGRGFVIGNDLSPVPGFLVNRDTMIRLRHVPEVFVEKEGIKHVIVWFDGETPIYAVWDEALDDSFEMITTRDFVTYSGPKNERMTFSDVWSFVIKKRIENVLYEKNGKLYGVKRSGGRRCAIVVEEDKTRLVVSEGKYSKKFTIPLGRDKFKNVYVYRNVVSISFEGVSVLLDHDDDETVVVNGIPVDVNEVEGLIKEKWAMRVKDVIKNVPIENSRVKRNDVMEIIRKMRKNAPFFGPLVAMPSRSQVWTRRGRLIIRKTPEKIPEDYLPLIEWIMYMNDDYDEYFKNYEPAVHINGEDIGIKICPRKSGVKRVGKFYYWPDKNTKTITKYFGSAGFTVHDNAGTGVAYNPKDGVIGVSLETMVMKNTVDKLKRGEKITISDMIPGLPASAAIENNKIYLPDRVLKIKITKVSKDGVWYRLPFADGIYDVFVPFGHDGSVWKAKYSDEVDLEKRAVVEMQFLRELNVTKFYFYDKWGDAFRFDVDGQCFLEVYMDDDRIKRVDVHVGKKTYTKVGDEAGAMLSAARNYDEFITLLLMS